MSSERFAVGDRVRCADESVGAIVGREYMVVGVLDWSLDGKVEQAVELDGVNGAILASRFRLVDDGQALALGDDGEEPTVLAVQPEASAIAKGLDAGLEVQRLLQAGSDDEFWLSAADDHGYHILSIGILSLVVIDPAHDAAIVEELVELLNLGMDVRRHHARAAKNIA